MSDLVEKLRKAADWGEDEFDVLSPQDAAAAADRIEALRKTLIDAGRNAGALLADDVSDEFLAYVPGEVKGRIEALERAPAVARFVERERCAAIAEGEAHEHGRAAHAIAAAIRTGEAEQ